MMKYFSMFSGIGGFELVFEKGYKKVGCLQQNLGRPRNSINIEGWRRRPKCVGFSEIDKYAIQTYEKHFPTHKNWGNARKIIPEELPDFDMLCGGFPCQSFSIAGKRKGFQDTRGTLFHEICRIVAVKKPRLLFLENVKGLLSADNGRCFATIISSLDELGYNVEWQVLNSKNFGVPQNRERVFIIEHLRGTSSRQIFPFKQSNQEINQSREFQEQIASTLTTAQMKQGRGMTMIQQKPFIAKPILMPNRVKSRQNGRRIKNENEDMFTLTAMDIHGITFKDKIRRLTPIECERLQGFPDNWTIGSDTQRYKQLGNAVTVNVIEAIATSLKN